VGRGDAVFALFLFFSHSRPFRFRLNLYTHRRSPLIVFLRGAVPTLSLVTRSVILRSVCKHRPGGRGRSRLSVEAVWRPAILDLGLVFVSLRASDRFFRVSLVLAITFTSRSCRGCGRRKTLFARYRLHAFLGYEIGSLEFVEVLSDAG